MTVCRVPCTSRSGVIGLPSVARVVLVAARSSTTTSPRHHPSRPYCASLAGLRAAALLAGKRPHQSHRSAYAMASSSAVAASDGQQPSLPSAIAEGTKAIPHPRNKAHKTAVCIVPPKESWAALQDLRCFNDKSFLRWMPHINLLYPFWEDSGSNLQDAAERIREALAEVPPFKVTLSEFGHFGHKNYCTVWLAPDEIKDVQGLQGALARAFPECSDLSDDPGRGITEFAPHLSVANVGVKADRVEEHKEALGAKWETLSFEVAEVYVISRSGFDDPFATRFRVPLGGGRSVEALRAESSAAPAASLPAAAASALEPSGASMEDLREPYVASVGSDPDTQEGGAAFLGPLLDVSGSGAQGVWNFAYGANINKTKLSTSRSLTPLESKPACLRGYRLTFRHRGGFGTVERSLMRREEGDDGAADVGPQDTHGVLHLLSPAEYGKLCGMEHEYRPVEVEVEPYNESGPVRAVVFVAPPERLIRDGLPPTERYLGLLQEGAKQWGLDDSYTSWLNGLESVDNAGRGDDYYRSPDGAQRLEPWPKIYTGSQPNRNSNKRHGGGRGNQRRGGRGRGAVATLE